MSPKRPASSLGLNRSDVAVAPSPKRVKLEREDAIDAPPSMSIDLKDAAPIQADVAFNGNAVPKQEADALAQPICMDPNGNLLLVLGEDRIPYVVDASALRRSSGLFNEVYGGDGGGFDQMPPTLDFPDVDTAAMEVLLNIVHAKFIKVPEKPDLTLLCNIVLMADRFEMLHVLRPWAQRWADMTDDTDAWKSEQEDAPNIEDLQRITCAYHLNRGAELMRWLLPVILKTSKSDDEDGWLMYASPSPKGGQCLLPWRSAIPDNTSRIVLTSHVCSAREDALQHLLDTLGELLASCGPDAEENQLSPVCSQQCIGIIYQHLAHAQLCPLPSARAIRMSPVRLSAIISDILSDVSSSLDIYCRCQTVENHGGRLVVPKKCVFPQDNITLLSEYVSETLSKQVTRAFRQVLKCVAIKQYKNK